MIRKDERKEIIPDSMRGFGLEDNIDIERAGGMYGINMGELDDNVINIPDKFSEQIEFWKSRKSSGSIKHIRHKPKRSELSVPFRHEDIIWDVIDITDKDIPDDIDRIDDLDGGLTQDEIHKISNTISKIVDKYALFIRQWEIKSGSKSIRVDISFRDGYEPTMIQEIIDIVKKSLPANMKLLPYDRYLPPKKMIDKQGRFSFEIIKISG